ncbi:MAG: SLC13 family permease [Candidatus Thorarchaeota archaeon]
MLPVSTELAILFIVLAVVLVLFVIGRWRYDIIALSGLLALTVTGIIPLDQVFLGFVHPAVVTVAAVLIICCGLNNSGVVDIIVREMSRVGDNTLIQLLALTGLVIVLSAFMNNIGALALLIPVTIRMARRSDKSPSLLLMPLAFCSILGGLITMIGTPSNIIIATFRAQNGQEPFLMFDFLPVGLGVAVAGMLFMSLVGWRLIPQREGAADADLSLVDDYITEVHIPEESKMVGKRIYDLESASEADIAVVALLRKDERFNTPHSLRSLKAGDHLIVRGETEDLKILVEATELELAETKRSKEDILQTDDVTIIEVVIATNSIMDGKSARRLNLHGRYGVNLLAVSRQGRRLRAQIGDIRLRIGDVLLLQAPTAELNETLSVLGCLPLIEREMRFEKPHRTLPTIGIFTAALLASAVGLLPVQIAFVMAALAIVVVGVVPPDEAYKAIDWQVIVLLGAMIPVGHALETTGGSQLIATMLVQIGGAGSPFFVLTMLLVIAVLLSCIVHNAGIAILLAPIGMNIALQLSVSMDPFLMAVAVGSASGFLTPIGHPSELLVMGPGGYMFGDYFRVGFLLEIIVIILTIMLIPLFWPF